MTKRGPTSRIYLGYQVSGGAGLSLRIDDVSFKGKSIEEIRETPLYRKWEQAFQKMVEAEMRE